MTMNIVYPVGARHFIVQIFDVLAIPDHIGFTGYCDATCEIVLEDGQTSLGECVLQRPRDRRNVVGIMIKDCLLLVFVTDLTERQLTYATIRVTRYGGQLSEEEASLRADRSHWHLGSGDTVP